ncbi:Protein_required for cell viability [Hexamita inflata]|uniref:Protein required for cell viability n=1 Tax=Hexamita inflata TaxID=28002 RepID=A0AA86R4C1_9EUKA|nr:Protein required for cell viability [Hexamita inflata]
MKNKFRQIQRPNRTMNTKRTQQLQNEFEKQNKDTNEESSSSTFSIPEDLLNEETKVFQPETQDTDNITTRMVINGLDWDRINSQDLYVLASSFIPTGGALKFVSVYQSNYGRNALKLEEVNGPDLQKFQKEAFASQITAEPDTLKRYKKLMTQDPATAMEIILQNPVMVEKISNHKVRLYEMDKQNFYYAVLEFDSKKTCETVFNQIQGFEFESIGCILQCLVLEDETWESMKSQAKFFENEPAGYLKSKCDEMPLNYQYSDEGRSGTLMTKPELNFDRTDKERAKAMKNLKLDGNLDEKTLKKYFNFEGSNDDEELDQDEENEEGEEFEESNNKQDEKDEFEDIRDLIDDEKQNIPKLNLKFKTTFNQEKKQTEETPFQKFLKSKQTADWEYREQNKAPENVKVNVSRDVQNLFKKLNKQIKIEDNAKQLSYLLKKKQKMEEKYPDLKKIDEDQFQILKLDDDRFQEVFEGGDEFDGEGAVGDEQRKRRDKK